MKKRILLFGMVACVTILPGSFILPVMADVQLTENGFAVQSGDYTVNFLEKAAWSFNTISYKEEVILTPTGASQAVVRQPDDSRKDKLFIGNSHGEEQIEKIAILADGKEYALEQISEIPDVEKYTVSKQSLMGAIRYHSTVEINPDGIVERSSFSAEESLEGVDFLYVFMHCWSNKFRDWMVILPDGNQILEQFKDDKSTVLKQDIAVLGVWSEDLKMGALLQYKEPYEGRKGLSNFLWDRPRDNKHYLCVSPEVATEAGREYEARITVLQPEDGDWKKVVQAAAGKE